MILPFLEEYFFPLAILGSMFLGNFFIFAASALIANGTFEFWKVLVCVFIGVNITDLFWFFVGKSRIINYFHLRLKDYSGSYKNLENKIRNSGDGRKKSKFFVLLFSKYIYGIEALMVVFFSKMGMTFKKFLFYNIPVSIIWVSTLVSIGWMAGRGYIELVRVYDNFRIALIIILAVLFCLYFIWIKISQRLLKDISSKK